jgi:nucleotide-binding universal stress UspA family protein
MESSQSRLKKILIAVEDFATSDAIVDFVANHSWHPAARFKVMHVMNSLPAVANIAGVPVAMPRMVTPRQEAQVMQLIDKIVRIMDGQLAGRLVEGCIEQGDPKSTILDFAREWPADLIVMGSHGRKGLNRWVFGSFSQSVAASAPCSVIILRADNPAKAA